MNIVVFVHPIFSVSQSMPRFADMIVRGMQSRNHSVAVWTAKPYFYNLPVPKKFKKWLGYIDQFIVFPLQVKWSLIHQPKDTLYIFSDQGLGPWVPLVAHRAHVIHAHDFMALRSALGEYVQNSTRWPGKLYQAMIRRGFSCGRNFISVSKNTRDDLERYLPFPPRISEVVYNGFNYPFRQMAYAESIASLASLKVEVLHSGFLLHVGGNQWYKNRLGVLEIYEAYIKCVENPLPLVMIGSSPTKRMEEIGQRCKPRGIVLYLTGLSNEQVCASYSMADLLLFPSLAEGFGWPIAEAMACGCMVLTTKDAPMTEVGGDAAFYISKRPDCTENGWAENAAQCVVKILGMSQDEKNRRHRLGLLQITQFDTERVIQRYETIYHQAIGDGLDS